MARIDIASGLFIEVDEQDLELLRDKTIGANVSIRLWDNGKSMKLGRFLLEPGPNMMVDHINRNPFDFRRSNLRICTRAENARNRGKHRSNGGNKNRSKYKGVHRSLNRWHAEIRVAGRTDFLGSFISEEDAARAYDIEARKRFGGFAACNFALGAED